MINQLDIEDSLTSVATMTSWSCIGSRAECLLISVSKYFLLVHDTEDELDLLYLVKLRLIKLLTSVFPLNNTHLCVVCCIHNSGISHTLRNSKWSRNSWCGWWKCWRVCFQWHLNLEKTKKYFKKFRCVKTCFLLFKNDFDLIIAISKLLSHVKAKQMKKQAFKLQEDK